MLESLQNNLETMEIVATSCEPKQSNERERERVESSYCCELRNSSEKAMKEKYKPLLIEGGGHVYLIARLAI